MNKKSAIAFAIGVAFAAPELLAQTTADNLTIYGRLYPHIGTFQTTGATAFGTTGLSTLVAAPTAANGLNHGRRNVVNAGNGRLGFRGTENLGGDMGTIWQIETRVRIDSGDGGQFANRNSFVGLRTGFGTVKFGNFDSIVDDWGSTVGMFGVTSGNFNSTTDMATKIGTGTDDSGSFSEREANSFRYESPTFGGGFQVGIQYSPSPLTATTGATGTGEAKGPGSSTGNAKLWAYGLKYESGPYYVALTHERHNDLFGGSNNSGALTANTVATGSKSRDTMTRLSGRWKILPEHTLEASAGRLVFKESGQAAAGRFDEYKKTSFDIGWEAKWGGPWRTSITYARASDGSCTLSGGVECTTAGMASKQYNLGLAYDFSKRTFLHVLYTRVNNGPSAIFDRWENGTPARGSDATHWGVGIAHNF